MPYRPGDHWQEYFGEMTYNDAIDRLGNMAILSKNDNMEQEPFRDKRKVLAKSHYRINQKIAEYDSWDMENPDVYQSWLEDQAKSVWQIDGL